MAHAVITLKPGYVFVDASIRKPTNHEGVFSLESRQASFPWRVEQDRHDDNPSQGESYCYAIHTAMEWLIYTCPKIDSVDIVDRRWSETE